MKKIFLLSFAVLLFYNLLAQNLIKGNQRFEEYLPLLENNRVGIVCNHTSIINKIHLVDTLLTCGVNVQAIFSPEHGFKGSEEAGRLINGVNYYKDTIKIISLYGKNKKPTDEQIEDIDVIIFDLQDVGCRFYTYISTLEYVIQACEEDNKKIIVLDRPNPNNFVAGPVLKDDCKSFVGMQNIPICYGLTIGEYAFMLQGECFEDTLQQLDLTVIKMLNYNRDSIYVLDVFPSPNLQTMQAIRNYPTLCLFEGTVISVGRGTNMPFEIVGFPNNPNKTISFIPKAIKGVAENPPFKDKLCYGKMINIDTNEILLDYIIDIYKEYSQKEKFFNSFFDLLVGDKVIKQQIIDGRSADEIKKSWQKDLDAYKEIRKKYLMY